MPLSRNIAVLHEPLDVVLPFGLTGHEVITDTSCLAKSNVSGQMKVSPLLVAALHSMHTVVAAGDAEDERFYVEITTRDDRREAVVIDAKNQSILVFAQKASTIPVYTAAIKALAASIAAASPRSNFTRLFHLPSTHQDKAAFLRMTDELYQMLSQMDFANWRVEQIEATEVNIKVQRDALPRVFGDASRASDFRLLSSSSTRTCKVCGKPLTRKMADTCSDSCTRAARKAKFRRENRRIFEIDVDTSAVEHMPQHLKDKIIREPVEAWIDPVLAKMISNMINRRMNIRLIGEPGTGKTTLAERIAYDAGLPYVYVPISKHTETADFQGKWRVEGDKMIWENAEMADAVQYGCVIHIDEGNLGEAGVMAFLHPLLDQKRLLPMPLKGGPAIKAHPNTIIISTQNPNEARFGGVQPSNDASDDRWVPIRIDHLPTDLQVELLADKTGCTDKKLVAEVVRLAEQLRTLRKNHEIRKEWTARGQQYLIYYLMDGTPIEYAIESAVVGMVAEDEIEAETVRDLCRTTLSGAMKI